MALRSIKGLQAKQPGDDLLCDKAQHAESKHEEQHKRTKLSGFGLFGQVPDDEQHEQHKATQPECQAEMGHLFFC